MNHALVNTPVGWPHLSFGPVNLWSLPAAWKRVPVDVGRMRTAPLSQLSKQVNPQVTRLLSQR